MPDNPRRAFDHVREAGYRFRLWLMWKVSPLESRTLDGVLEGIQEIEDDDFSEYDSARELRYLFRFVDEGWFTQDHNNE